MRAAAHLRPAPRPAPAAAEGSRVSRAARAAIPARALGRLVLGALLGRLGGGAEVQRGVDQRNVGEGLRKVAEETPGDRIVLLGKQADVVGEAEEALEQRARFVHAALQAKVVGEPEAAGEEHALARRQPVDRLVREVALHQAVDGQFTLDGLYGLLYPG